MTVHDLATLSPARRRRGLIVLQVYTFVMVIGFTMVMPLVAVHFVDRVGMAATAVGVALAVRQLTQQGLTMVGGALGDRFGARRLICLGVLVRATGFASLAFAGSTATLLASMILSALGGALFEAPYQASIAALTTTANRARYYAISNWTSGVATALGPLIGIALLRFDFQRVCLAAAACFLLNYAIALFLPSVPVVTGRSLTHGFRLVLAERRFVMLTVVMMGYWFVASQLNISFALQAYALTGSQDSVGVMFVLSAGLTIAFQYALVRVLEGRVRGARLLVVGVAIMSCAAGAVAFAPGFASFLTCVGVFAVGAILTRPTQQALAASMARPEAFGTFLGFAALGQAVGGGIGNVAGGWLVDVATATAWTALPWLAFNAVGLLTAMGLLVLTRRPSAADSTSSQTTAIPVRRV